MTDFTLNLNGLEILNSIEAGNINADNIIIKNDLTVLGDQILQGNTLIQGNQTLDGNSIITGTLNVNGHTDFDGDVNIDGQLKIDGHLISTDDIQEGINNLYFTTQRSRDAITGGTNISYITSTGSINLDIKQTAQIGTGDLGKWLNANYGGSNDYGIGQWSFGRVRLYTPTNYGSFGYSKIDSLGNITDVFKIEYNGTANLYGFLTVQNDLVSNHITAQDWIKATTYIDAPQYKVSGVNLNTSHIPETNPNLYFTTTRARNSLSSGGNGIIYDQPSGQISWGGSTANVNEDPNYLYFTTARSRLAITGTSPITYNNTSGVIGWNGTTTNVTEGSNLYFTTARARTSLLAGSGISYDNSTGIISTSTPNYWTLSGSTISNNITNVSLKNPYIEQPIQVVPTDSKWIYKNYGGAGAEVGLAQLSGYDMAFYSPTTNGSWSYYVYDGTNYTVREKTYYNGDKYLWGSGSFELKNTGSNGSVIKLYNASANGFHLYQDNTNNRIRISSKNGASFTEIFDLNAIGELGLGGSAPRSGYALNLNKGIYINDGAEHMYFVGNDSLFNYKSEMLFNANGTVGTITHNTTGFNVNRPFLMSSTSTHQGLATFNGGVNSNAGYKLTIGDPGKMNYVEYNNIRDIYGIGQFNGGVMRMFSASSTGAFWSSCNMSSLIDNASNLYVDHIRTQNGKVGILAFQDITPDQVNNLLAPLKWTSPSLSTSQYDGAFKVQLERNGDATYYDSRTFTTITQNVGIITPNKVESNVWIQGIRSLQNGGESEVEYYETKFATYNNPNTNIQDNNYNLDNKAQFRINGYSSQLGDERQLMALYYNGPDIPGNGGFNQSNVRFPQCARAAYYNAFFDPYGFVYPDVYASDARLKKNIIKQDENILNEFRQINVVNYNWDYEGEHKDFCSQQPRTITDKLQIGIIAQNLEELPIIKEKYKIVDTYQFSSELPSGKNSTPWDKKNFKPEKEFLILNKERLPFLNMKAIQETNKRIDDLGGVDLEELRNENSKLKEELITVKTELNNLISLLKKKFII